MHNFRRFLSALLFLPLLSTAQDTKIPFDSKVKTGQLPNGLKYFIVQNKKPEKKIELRLALNAGSILEDNDQQGLAHLMEHMNFNGLQHFPGNEVVHYLQSIGVDFGADLNAYTSFDETVYILPIPADDKKKIDQGFQIIADWSNGALLADDEINKERGVVLEESRLGKGADDRMMKVWLPEYLNGSRYGERLPIGKDSILKNFPPDVIRRFHKDWYRPDLEAVMVVGDIEPAEAERLIKEKFSGYKNPATPRVRPASFDVPARTMSKAMVVSDKEAAYTLVRIMGNTKPEKQATTVGEWKDNLEESLFNMMLSTRFEELRNGSNPPFIFAGGGYGGLGVGRGLKAFNLIAVCGTDKIEAATEALVKESMRVKNFGFTQSELDRAKAMMMASYEKNYNERDKTESKTRVDELVRHFLTNEPVPGTEWEYNYAKTTLPNITLTEVNSFKRLVDIDQSYFALVTTKTGDKLPSDADVKGYVDNSLRANVAAYTETALPKSLLSSKPTAGKIVKEEKDAAVNTTTWTLSNGAKVTWKKTDFKNDEILFSGYRWGGSSTYNGSDYMSADMSNNVVDEMGYGEFSKTNLGKFMSGKTARVETFVDLNSDNVQGSSSVKDLETAMQLLYLKSTAPRKDETAFASYKDRELQMIAQAKSDPETLFSDSLNNFRFANNPRMKELHQPGEYETINADNALAFYKGRFASANGMQYFFVGSIPEATFKNLVETYIGGLGGNAVAAKMGGLNIDPIAGKQNFTLRAGTEQKAMVADIAYMNTPYVQDDEVKLNLLGEVINNRVTDILREKMSAIYSGGAGLRLTKFPKDRFTMNTYLPCGPENVEKVRTAFWEIVGEVKKPGNVKADELDKGVQTALQRYRVGIKTNNFWLATLAKYQQNGLPTTNINNAEARLKAVTPAMLTATADKYLSGGNVVNATWLPGQ